MDAGINSKPLAYLRNRYILAFDLAFIILSALGSFALRLELSSYQFYFPAAVMMTIVSLIIKPIIYYFFGLYRRLWVYASTNELKLIALSVTVASMAVSFVMLALFSFDLVKPGFPRSVLGIDWLLSLILVGGLRFGFRILSETQSTPERIGKKREILIIGAGDAGALVVRELQRNRQSNLIPVGFLDDDAAKQGHQIYGIPVVGKISNLAKVLDNQNVDEVIIAIPSAPGSVVRAVADVCRVKGIPSRTMPGIFELLGGKVSVSRLREVDISDLLRREPVQIQNELVSATLKEKRILVTGAGGSIGREICRQIAQWKPSQIILLGHGENSIFESLLELKEDFPDLILEPVIADVRDATRLKNIFEKYHPQVVFHAAAHKHVPLMESNVQEAVTNNIFGTRNVVNVSMDAGVERLVMISTDKAVHPVNVMGATKRLAEMIVLDAAARSGKPFSVVRFGNVLGSRGSVVPLFKQQIARGGPVTVTHPEMRRYFMTIPEAVHLVLQAAAMGQGREAFMLNMGEQVRILDLAEDLIRLSGLEPGRDIEIVFSGSRAGDKLSEELLEAGTHYENTAHPDIFRVNRDKDLQGDALASVLSRLEVLAQNSDADSINRYFDEVVPGSAIMSAPHSSGITDIV